MKLSTWISREKTNQNQIAVATGVSPSVLSRFLSGETSLSVKNAQRIVKHTKGEVGLDDLIRETDALKDAAP